MSKLDDLDLNWSDDDIHSAFQKFAMKWQDKAERVQRSDRITRL